MLCGVAWDIHSMILFRALQGLLGASMIPTVFTSSFFYFQGSRRVYSAAVIGTIAPEESSHDAISELKNLIIRLEKTMNAQSRAFRALVDLLQDKGIVRRGELGQRTSKK